MENVKLSCAVWPWGVENKAQMIQALKDIKAVGYEAFESVKKAIGVFDNNVTEFKAIVDEYGIKPVSFYFHMAGDDKIDVEDLEKNMPFLEALDIHRISLQATRLTGRKPTQEELGKLLNSIQKIGRITSRFNVTPCVHPHYGTMIMYEDEIDFIMQNTDPDYVAFGPDTAHLAVGLCDAADVMERYASRIKFVHLKDFIKGESVGAEESGSVGVEIFRNFREMGEGSVDFKRVFKVLKNAGYDGYVCAELDVSRFGNKESARMNYDYFMKNYYY